MVLEDSLTLDPPKEASLWRSEPCYSLSWQVGEKWHYIAGDCVEKPSRIDQGPVEFRPHSYFGLNMVLSGTAVYRDWRDQRHPLKPGVVYQRLPDASHSVDIASDCEWCEVYLTLRKRTVQHLYDLGLVERCPVYYVRHPELLLNQYTEILDTLSHANTVHMPQLLVQIQNLLIAIREDAEQSTDPDPYRKIIADACAIMDCNLHEELDIEALAADVGMAYETFRKAFKERKGIAPGAYRVRKRIERSCILLRTTTLPVNVIGEKLGYSDGFAYSAQFKKLIGMAPSAYRLAH